MLGNLCAALLLHVLSGYLEQAGLGEQFQKNATEEPQDLLLSNTHHLALHSDSRYSSCWLQVSCALVNAVLVAAETWCFSAENEFMWATSLFPKAVGMFEAIVWDQSGTHFLTNSLIPVKTQPLGHT